MGQVAWAARAEPLIELGELSRVEPVDPPEPPTRTPRWLALILVAVLVAAGLASDAMSTRMHGVLLVSAEHGDFDVIGDVLYVFQGPYPPNQITAYRLHDGRRLWQIQSPATTTYSSVYQVADRTLIVQNPCLSAQPVTTMAVDTQTGRVAWRRPGTPEQPVTGGSVVVMSRPSPAFACGNGYTTTDVLPPIYWDAVNVSSGAVVWSTQIPPLARISFNGYDGTGSTIAVFVTRDGTVTSRDLRTGRLTGRMSRPELALPPEVIIDTGAPPGGPDLSVAGHRALITQRVGRGSNAVDVTSYDAVSLTRQWTARVDAGPVDTHPGGDYVGIGDCGPVLCLYAPDRTTFLDPRNGRVQWHTGLSVVASSGLGGLFADPSATGGEMPLGGLTLRDVRTGRVQADLTGWRALSSTQSTSGDPPTLGLTVAGKTWLAKLDLDRMEVSIIGSVDGLYFACAGRGAYLVCRRIDGMIRAWRVPDG
jgi:PQQ-like domain